MGADWGQRRQFIRESWRSARGRSKTARSDSYATCVSMVAATLAGHVANSGNREYRAPRRKHEGGKSSAYLRRLEENRGFSEAGLNRNRQRLTISRFAPKTEKPRPNTLATFLVFRKFVRPFPVRPTSVHQLPT